MKKILAALVLAALSGCVMYPAYEPPVLVNGYYVAYRYVPKKTFPYYEYGVSDYLSYCPTVTCIVLNFILRE